MRLDLSYTKPQLDIFFPLTPERHTIIPKGRRFGATRGAAHACIEWACEGKAILWGDTVHGNIERYWDRYFEPALKASGLKWKFDRVAKVARIGSGFIDFRSADKPENWEGFGYHKVIINEAGIILKNHYLYTNAVRPMLVDFPESELYALGVPKGKMLRDGTEHPFYTMWKRVGTPGYRGHTYSSYDNPILAEEDLKKLEEDIAAMDPVMVDQEIFGKFLDRVAGRPFAFAFDLDEHVKSFDLDHRQPIIVVLDFNVDPFCTLLCQQQGNTFGVAHEIAITGGTIEELVTRITTLAPHVFQHLYTGDKTGDARRIQLRSTASMWDDFLSAISARESQLHLPSNPTHKESREQVNYLLTHGDVRIDPRCTRLIHDMQVVEVDEELSIIKADRSKVSQQADLIDCFRYLCNTFAFDFITNHRRLDALQRVSQRPRPVTVYAGGRPDLDRLINGQWP